MQELAKEANWHQIMKFMSLESKHSLKRTKTLNMEDKISI